MNGEQGKHPTIFLIEEDDETRGVLVRNLRNHGYHVIVMVDAEDALERASEGNLKADLILVNLVGKPVEKSLAVGRRVREHAKYNGHTPLVVMPDKYDKDVEGTDVNVEGNDWIHYLGEEPDQLQNLLRRLTSKM
jgi:DNA-binding response OmpR family regulator